MNKDNSRVPVAILSCFLIAFILQGILKISGVFIFEKALGWEIFRIIDNNKVLNIMYYCIINILAVYALSFTFTKSCYSRKWYHYIIIFIGTTLITILRMLIKTVMWLEFVYDILMYIIIPFIVSITTEKDKRVFIKNDTQSCIITLSFEILLYLCFLGLSYWSGLLNSLIPEIQTVLYASTHFLVFFEVYIGLYMMMLSVNIILQKIYYKEA